MERNHFGLHNGDVYIKIEESKYTYVHCSTVHDFLMRILSSPEIADIITPFIGQITSLLSDPACRLIRPISIDYNYIEVLPQGCCFNIEKKSFEMDPKELNGSPRAFIYYHYRDYITPYPKLFVEGN